VFIIDEFWLKAHVYGKYIPRYAYLVAANGYTVSDNFFLEVGGIVYPKVFDDNLTFKYSVSDHSDFLYTRTQLCAGVAGCPLL